MIDLSFLGTGHGNCVFSSSELIDGMKHNRLMYFPSSSYNVIGECAFPLRSFLLLPYNDTGRLTTDQVRFFIKLSKTIVITGYGIGFLKE